MSEPEPSLSELNRCKLCAFSICSSYLLSVNVVYVGLADSSSASNTSNNEAKNKSSPWLKIFIICLGLLAVSAFSVYLFKLWQRKKREEQHARLLKLFEQDDELEVELGIRD